MSLRIVPVSTPPDFSGVRVWEIDAGLMTHRDMVAGASCYAVIDEEGQLLGSFALTVDDYPGGRVAWITAGEGKWEDGDLTRVILPRVEAMAEADYMAIRTLRPGLVRKLVPAGYGLGGTILMKRLHS